MPARIAQVIRGDGCGYSSGEYVDDNSDGVRPALHLNLSSSVWKKGEIVTSEDKQKEESGGSQNTDNQNTNTTSGHINLSMELRSTESGVR